MTEREYNPLAKPDESEVEQALLRNDAPALQAMVLGVSMFDEDDEFAQDLAARLTGHADELVRGNAILALGHIARRFGELRPELIESISAARSDPSEYVRGQAHAAAGDASHFLGVEFPNLT